MLKLKTYKNFLYNKHKIKTFKSKRLKQINNNNNKIEN